MSVVSIRYMIDDVPTALKFYTTHLGFTVDMDASPAFASVTRDGVRLLLERKNQLRSSSHARRSRACSRRMESHSHTGR